MQALSKEMANFGKEQGKHIAAAKAKLKAAKAGVEAAKKLLKTKQAALTEALAQQEAAGAERASLAEQETASKLAIEGTPCRPMARLRTSLHLPAFFTNLIFLGYNSPCLAKVTCKGRTALALLGLTSLSMDLQRATDTPCPVLY